MGNDIEAVGSEKDLDYTVREIPASQEQDEKRDAVFGEITDKGPNYRAMGVWATLVVMLKTQIGLGVLSVPFLFQVIGMVPGVIAFTVMAVCITWCNYQVGEVKLKYREVYSIDDLGYLIGGTVGRWVMGAALLLYFIPIAGSGMLAVSIAFNAMSTHAQCTAVFVVISALITFAAASIQTLGRISWLAWVGTISVFVAVFTLVIAVAVQDRPAAAPQTGPWDKQLIIAATPSFAALGSTLGGIIFTLAGTPAFFGIVSEMRQPERFGKPVIWCQVIITSMCLFVGIICYYYCGIYVASPAPGSAGVLMKKIVYGLGFPGILMSTVVYTHFSAKYIFVKVLRGSRHLASNTWQHWVIWFSCTGGVCLVAYVIASGLPLFSALTSLIGALVGPALSLEPMGVFYLRDNWFKSTDRSVRNKVWCAWALAMVLFGVFCQVSGTYGAVVDIKAASDSGSLGKPWSCADNSNSV